MKLKMKSTTKMKRYNLMLSTKQTMTKQTSNLGFYLVDFNVNNNSKIK